MQAQPDVKFSVLVTGDHSTPVMFGDHSHEPVPLAIADVSDVVSLVGQEEVMQVDLGPLPPLTQHVDVPEALLKAQAVHQKQLRRVHALDMEQGFHDVSRSDEERASASHSRVQIQVDVDSVDVKVSSPGRDAQHTRCFDEICAARGELGRFPSSELMPLICSALSG